MNILVVSQFYPPDLGAVAFRMMDLVKELEKQKHKVFVLTATPNRYSDYKVNIERESKNIRRIKLKGGSRNTLSRIKGFFEFYFKVIRSAKFFKNKEIDLVVSTTPYLLEGLAGQKIAKRLNATHLLDVRDLWPKTAIALGKISENGIVARLLRILEKKVYNNADRIIVTSPGYIGHINQITKEKKEIVTVFNGIDQDFLEQYNNVETISSKRHNKVVTYAGNLGVAQNLITLVKVAKLMEDSEYSFKLIGSGSQLNEINEYIKNHKINNVEIVKPVKREQLIKEYVESDVLYLQLYNNVYFSEVVPSKIFEYLLTNKPIVYGLEGVSKELLGKYQGTYNVQPDNIVNQRDVLLSIDFEKRIFRDIQNLLRSEQTKKTINIINELKKSEENKL